ncbi:epoxide hydrolase N-terminal domain-containing protein [Streptomyces sp. NPDC046900]|uniref:epoxide hydrolase N-terminal domain-containing protein n=1 Tax=Streptomyces sp. NPDC046900 TaxID=3155473 RepID=UPI00340423AA
MEIPHVRNTASALSTGFSLHSAVATAAVVAGSFGLFPAQQAAAATAAGSRLDATARGDIRRFRFHAPHRDLVDLRRRIMATRWPEHETVADQSQGVQLATMKELARYWASDYDRRKVHEAERPAAHRHPQPARLDHRTTEDGTCPWRR